MHVFRVNLLLILSFKELIDKLDSVEDTKGNNGDRGTILTVKFNCHAITKKVQYN